MGVIATDTGGDFEPIPLGLHRAICLNVFDIGYQPGYQGAPPAHKVVILWEIEPRNRQGKRFTITKFYTLSLFEKATLGADLISWRGKPFTDAERKGFDLDAIKGKPCQLNIVPKGEKAAIASVLPAQRVANPATGKNEPTMHWQPETPASFVPNFVERMIAQQLPPPAPATGTTMRESDDGFTDEIPF
jgi:hypothetical protein